MTWLLAAAAILFFLTAWIALPGWTPLLLNLSVGAPEVSAWLLVGSAAVSAAATALARTSRLSGITIVLALLSAGLASAPLVRARLAIPHFDAEMTRALGENYLAGVPPAVLDGMRKRPLVFVDLLRGLDFGSPTVTRGIALGAPEGQPLTTTLYRPAGAGPFPTIVQIYGGAWQRGTPNDYPEFARYLSARGYLVVAIDYRHAPRWTWPAQIADVRAALAWVHEHASEYGADVDRLALMGRSAGAQLAMLAAYEPRALPVGAVISYSGPVDLADGYRHPPSPDPLEIRAIEEAFLGGPPDRVPDRYRDASPIAYVTRPLPPTLLIYGTRDDVVEVRFGRMLHDRLTATGTRSALIEIPWANHAFDAVPSGISAQIALYYTERFLAWALK